MQRKHKAGEKVSLAIALQFEREGQLIHLFDAK